MNCSAMSPGWEVAPAYSDLINRQGIVDPGPGGLHQHERTDRQHRCRHQLPEPAWRGPVNDFGTEWTTWDFRTSTMFI